MTSSPNGSKTRTDLRSPDTVVLPRAIGVSVLVVVVSGVFGAGAWTAALSQRVSSLEQAQGQRISKLELELATHRDRGAHPVADNRIDVLEAGLDRAVNQGEVVEGRLLAIQQAVFALCAKQEIDCTKF